MLLLDFLISRCIPGVRGSEGLSGRQLLGMHGILRARFILRSRFLVIRHSCLFGGFAARSIRGRGTGHACAGRGAANRRSALLWIGACRLGIFILSGHGWDMPFMRSIFLLRRGTPLNASTATVVADPGFRVVDDCRVVHVVNIGDVHIADRTVVEEVSFLPPSTFIAFAEVSVAVTDSAVEADMQSPVAFIEGIAVAAPSPIARGPKKTRLGSHDPRARHPSNTPCRCRRKPSIRASKDNHRRDGAAARRPAIPAGPMRSRCRFARRPLPTRPVVPGQTAMNEWKRRYALYFLLPNDPSRAR